TLSDSDTELVLEHGRHLTDDGSVPTADKNRSYGTDFGLESGVDASLDAAQESLGRRNVVLPGKQERDVDGDAGEERLFDGRQTFHGARNFAQQIGSAGPGVQTLRRSESASRVVSQQRRNLQRHPAVDAVGAVVNRPEEIGGLCEILEC